MTHFVFLSHQLGHTVFNEEVDPPGETTPDIPRDPYRHPTAWRRASGHYIERLPLWKPRLSF